MPDRGTAVAAPRCLAWRVDAASGFDIDRAPANYEDEYRHFRGRNLIALHHGLAQMRLIGTKRGNAKSMMLSGAQ